jgi:DNA anti-recombination protein RmuC
LADATVWILLAGLMMVVGILLWMRSSLQKAMTDMSVNVKTVSSQAQNIGNTAAGVDQTVRALGSQINQISVQAERIATLSQRYEETEKMTKVIHSVLIGSYTKGKAGEEALGNIMNDLIKLGHVKRNQPIGAGRVEYAIVFNDRKMLAIDSKVVSTEEVARLYNENTSDEEKLILIQKIKRAVRDKIAEVQKYIRPPDTLDMAVLAVPDSVMEKVNELIPEASEKNVILLGYSAVPQLITYFLRIHGFYAIKEDVRTLKDSVSKAQVTLSSLDERFFQGGFTRPLQKLDDSANTVKRTVLEVNHALGFNAGRRHEVLPEVPTVKEEETIQVPAST